jgi:HlyD family secretion protein
LKAKHIAALVTIAVIAIWGGYTGYNRLFVQEGEAAATKGQVVPVTRGTLRATVSAYGAAVNTQQVKLSFGVSGVLGELLVKVGDRVEAGQALARLDQATITSLQRAVTQAQSSLNIARIELEEAQQPYTELDLASARRSVAQAEANLEVAKKELEEAQHPYSDLDIAQARAAVRNAEVALENAQRNLSATETDPTTNENIRQLSRQVSYYENTYGRTLARFKEGNASQEALDRDYSNMLTAREKLAAAQERKEIALASARNEVEKAKDALAKAKADLEEKLAGADPKTVEKKRNQVIAAEDALAKAKADLEEKLAGADPKTVEKKRNQVIAAEVALENAKAKLDNATITAPYAGIVASIGPNVGEQVGANTTILTLVAPEAIEVDVNVSEIDVASLKVGQPAVVTFDGLPNRTYQGRVSFVSPTAVIQQGVANYPVVISLDDTSGIRGGMTASAEIIYEQRRNALLVPNRAIRTRGRSRIVEVVLADGSTQARRVRIGMSNDQYSEVLEGLQEGERVLIPVTTTTPRGVPGGRFFGGGPPGGRFGGRPPLRPPR